MQNVLINHCFILIFYILDGKYDVIKSLTGAEISHLSAIKVKYWVVFSGFEKIFQYFRKLLPMWRYYGFTYIFTACTVQIRSIFGCDTNLFYPVLTINYYKDELVNICSFVFNISKRLNRFKLIIVKIYYNSVLCLCSVF